MRNKSWRYYSLILILLVLLLTGCNFPGEPANPTQGLDQIVASTQTALAIETIIARSSPEIPTLPAATATGTAGEQATTQPTATIAPTATPTSAPPTPTQQPDCRDRAAFVSETVPDGTSVKPGEQIQKTWRLRNAGDCTWNTGYSLVFTDGSQMDAASPQPLTTEVAPGEVVELRVSLVAPTTSGTYRSEWMLTNAAGEEFGLGANGDRAFWVEIAVTDSGASLDLGTPDWHDGFESNLNQWYLGADDDVEFAIEDGNLIMTAFRPAGDYWRVAELRELGDFYLEAKATFGDECSDKDSFGFLVRAPDSESSILDSGYAFAFACDGNFRYYLMQDGEYVGLQNWRSASSLNSGPGQTNQVGVWAEGDQFRVYINGERVAEFTDSTYSRGLFGLLIRSAQTNNFSVAVDEMSYWLLP